ncbi:Gfo/Idh/MocA family protein [Streptosporangium sp. NPDC004631]
MTTPVTPSQRVHRRPIRVVLAGAGAMGLAWARAVHRHECFELAGIVDADPRQAKGAALRLRLPGLPVADSLWALPNLAADACVNATPPDQHVPMITQALEAGLSVLTEKPFATKLDQAVALTREAHARGRILMVSQSRSHQPGIAAFKRAIAELGGLYTLHARFSRSYPGAGFRADLDQPLLTDMAVHAFDAARLLTGSSAISVYCDAVERAGSGYRGAAEAAALFEMTDGSRFHYTGTWCAPALPTPWGGTWRAAGPGGTAEWDGAGVVRRELTQDKSAEDFARTADAAFDHDPVLQISRPLDDFADALITGRRHWGEATNNLGTMAMLEAAVVSARLRGPVPVRSMNFPAADVGSFAEEG